MLLRELFIIDDWQSADGVLAVQLHIRLSHPIFQGHFPGRPVLPGACLVQLVEELAHALAGRKLRLVRAGQIKFIAMIEPEREGRMSMTVQGMEETAGEAGGEWSIRAEGMSAGLLCFRFKGIFRSGSDYAG
jgi:3-hydroxyacyl-[acyl-carrier-protein] dehydratase